jgi:hypothetical protein
MTSVDTEGLITHAKSFSFYVGSNDRQLIQLCAAHSDAVTIRGASGPAVVRGMRARGFDAPVLFDGEGWRAEPGSIDAELWLRHQRDAGASRLLTPGRFVPWDKNGLDEAVAQITAEVVLASRLEATPLLGVDARWLAREPVALVDALSACQPGLALVLVEPGDPLALAGAVQGLRVLSESIANLFLLRSDHGSLGALAFGARHASLGLITGHRHGTTPERPGFGKPGDRSARVFSYVFADWFTAATIAGWALVEPARARCFFECCNGAELSRFLDEDAKAAAVRHNVVSLSKLADLVILSPDDERRATFLDYCSTAAERYDLSGVRGPQHPKPQLTGWVLS